MKINKFDIRLKEQREKAGLSQRELARLLGMSPKSIAAWEAGERSPQLLKIVKITKFFRVSLDYMLGLK